MVVNTKTIGQYNPKSPLEEDDLFLIQANSGITFNVSALDIANFVGTVGVEVFTWTDDHNADLNDLINLGSIIFGVPAEFPDSTVPHINFDGSVMNFSVPDGAVYFFSIGLIDKYEFSSTAFVISDANNIVVGSVTGTKIGTDVTQKIGFWDVTPIVQPAPIIDADGTLADITTKFNTLLAQMAATGLQAAS